MRGACNGNRQGSYPCNWEFDSPSRFQNRISKGKYMDVDIGAIVRNYREFVFLVTDIQKENKQIKALILFICLFFLIDFSLLLWILLEVLKSG